MAPTNQDQTAATSIRSPKRTAEQEFEHLARKRLGTRPHLEVDIADVDGHDDRAAATDRLVERLADKLPSWLNPTPESVGEAFYRFARIDKDRRALNSFKRDIEAIDKAVLPKDQCGRHASRSLEYIEYDDGTADAMYKGGVCGQSHCHRCGQQWLADKFNDWEKRLRRNLGEVVYVTYANTPTRRTAAVRYLADQKRDGKIEQHAGGVVPLLDGRFLILSTTPTKTWSTVIPVADAVDLVVDHLKARQKQAQDVGESPGGNPSFFGAWRSAKDGLPNSSQEKKAGKQREGGKQETRRTSFFAPNGVDDGAVFELVLDNGGQITTRKDGESWKFKGIRDPQAFERGFRRLGLRPQSELQSAKAHAEAERQVRESVNRQRLIEYDREHAFV